MNIHSEVCLLDYGGGCEIPPSELKECWKVAETSMKELCQLLEEALEEADEKAQQDRLERLQQQLHGDVVITPTLSETRSTPYFEQTDSTTEMNVEIDVSSDQITQAHTKAEEAYRRQALDYSQGHIASKVREDDFGDNRSSAQQEAASLLAAMLKSASQMKVPTNAMEEDMAVEVSHRGSEVELPPTKETRAGSNDEQNRATQKMDLSDDDEEEVPTVLLSEFQSAPEIDKKKAESKQRKEKKQASMDAPDSDIVDLSMAIKKKKKKSKKK